MMFGLSWLLRRKTAAAVRPSRVSRESHQSDEKKMRAEGFRMIDRDAFVARDGRWYIKQDVQQELIETAVADVREAFTRELSLPITPGTILRSIYEIKVAK